MSAVADDQTPSGTGPSAPAPAVPDTGYTDAGVPTLDGVREKIESRYGTAIGATELAEAELAAQSPEARTAAKQYEAQQKAAAEKLEEIRASMHKSKD